MVFFGFFCCFVSRHLVVELVTSKLRPGKHLRDNFPPLVKGLVAENERGAILFHSLQLAQVQIIAVEEHRHLRHRILRLCFRRLHNVGHPFANSAIQVLVAVRELDPPPRVFFCAMALHCITYVKGTILLLLYRGGGGIQCVPRSPLSGVEAPTNTPSGLASSTTNRAYSSFIVDDSILP